MVPAKAGVGPPTDLGSGEEVDDPLVTFAQAVVREVDRVVSFGQCECVCFDSGVEITFNYDMSKMPS